MAALAIPIIEFARDIFSRYIPDKNAAAQATADFAKRAQEQDFQLLLGQIETNKIEAASSSRFVSGWRPAIGWVCATALAVYYIPRFLVSTIFWSMLCYAQFKTGNYGSLPAMPDVGVMDILGLVATLLGSSGIRMVEKLKGVARS